MKNSFVYSLAFFWLQNASELTKVCLFTKLLVCKSLTFKNRTRAIRHCFLSASFYLSIRICTYIKKEVQLILGPLLSLLLTSSLESSISRKAFHLSIENESLAQTGGTFGSKRKTSKSKHVDIVLNVIVVPSQQVEPQLNRPINNMTPARSAHAQKIPPPLKGR